MWYIVIILLTITYLLINILLPSIHQLDSYRLTPLVWFIFAIIVLLIAQHQEINIIRYKKTRKWTLGSSPIHAGLLIGGFQIALLIIIGLFAGFGKNPYTVSITTLFFNIIFVTTFLLGTELSRTYLIKQTAYKRKNTTIALTLITLIYVLIRLQPSDLSLAGEGR